MDHLGDITKISGYEVPIVDCVIGGSPCQDLSVAGKRAGLEGERSGLFMEQIRIIKELRENDRRCTGRTGVDVRPRYMVWENVPGAFSSNKGEDFRIVLEETAKVAEETAVIPRSEKWSNAGCILGDGWSIAWRVLDAQFWGVPQRRRRIALVADFGGQSAPEILFVRKSVSGDIEQSQQKRKETPTDASGGIGTGYCDGRPSLSFQERAGKPGGGKGILIQNDRTGCLSTLQNQYVIAPCNWDGSQIAPTLTANNAGGSQRMPDKENFNCVLQPVYAIDQDTGKSVTYITKDVTPTLSTGHAHAVFQPVVYDARGNGDGKTAPTMTGDHQNRITDYTGVVVMDRAAFNQGQNAQFDFCAEESEVSPTIISKGPGAIAYAVDCRNGSIDSDTNGTLQLKSTGGTGVNFNNVVMQTVALEGNGQRPSHKGDGYAVTDKSCTLNTTEVHGVAYKKIRYIVRRLTPMECERLQGYPDGWTDIGEYINSKGKRVKTADSARYKALGNSIALPPWRWVLKRLCGCYERNATMASLFDGIGGFPIIWESINGKGSCLWASEIEEFPIAVTKERIK